MENPIIKVCYDHNTYYGIICSDHPYTKKLANINKVWSKSLVVEAYNYYFTRCEVMNRSVLSMYYPESRNYGNECTVIYLNTNKELADTIVEKLFMVWLKNIKDDNS